MGLITDIIPNHMGIMGSDNAWWLELPEKASTGYRELFSQGRVTAEPLTDHLRLCVSAPLKLLPLAILADAVE